MTTNEAVKAVEEALNKWTAMAKTWYLVIDYEKCIDCLTCVNFYPHEVHTVENGKSKVINLDNCVELCRGCQKLCTTCAITYSGGFNRNNSYIGYI